MSVTNELCYINETANAKLYCQTISRPTSCDSISLRTALLCEGDADLPEPGGEESAPALQLPPHRGRLAPLLHGPPDTRPVPQPGSPILPPQTSNLIDR